MPRASAALVVAAVAALGLAACSSAGDPRAYVLAETSGAGAGASASLPAGPVCEDAAAPVAGGARGMWVWGTKTRLDDPSGAATIVASARHAGLTEVYVSVNDGVLADPRTPAFVGALAAAGLRVEALMGEATWYRPEMAAEMLARIDEVGAYDAAHAPGFAAVHLDVEPHQLPENQDNHAFLPALATALGAAAEHARGLCMSTSADLPRFALAEDGPAFARAVPRVFVMLYELREKTTSWLVSAGDGAIEDTFVGLSPAERGRLVVSVRVEDYTTALGTMVSALDAADARIARYGGWAIHDEAKYRTTFARD